MVNVGEVAPDFTVPCARGGAYDNVVSFTLSEALGEGPIVLAFFPAAFTSGCTEEMCAFRDSMDAFSDLDTTVYGVSVDLPFAQNVWSRELDLNFPMLSDWDHEVIEKFDVIYEDMYGMIEAAERSVFILNAEGVVTYKWVRQGGNPDFDAFIAELQNEVDNAAEI